MKVFDLVKNDPWLEPYNEVIAARYGRTINKSKALTGQEGTLNDFASGHLFFGLHRDTKSWIIREWAPNATAMYLIGECNQWKESEDYSFSRKDHGSWELRLPLESLKHGQFLFPAV